MTQRLSHVARRPSVTNLAGHGVVFPEFQFIFLDPGCCVERGLRKIRPELGEYSHDWKNFHVL